MLSTILFLGLSTITNQLLITGGESFKKRIETSLKWRVVCAETQNNIKHDLDEGGINVIISDGSYVELETSFLKLFPDTVVYRTELKYNESVSKLNTFLKDLNDEDTVKKHVFLMMKLDLLESFMNDQIGNNGFVKKPMFYKFILRDKKELNKKIRRFKGAARFLQMQVFILYQGDCVGMHLEVTKVPIEKQVCRTQFMTPYVQSWYRTLQSKPVFEYLIPPKDRRVMYSVGYYDNETDQCPIDPAKLIEVQMLKVANYGKHVILQKRMDIISNMITAADLEFFHPLGYLVTSYETFHMPRICYLYESFYLISQKAKPDHPSINVMLPFDRTVMSCIVIVMPFFFVSINLVINITNRLKSTNIDKIRLIDFVGFILCQEPGLENRDIRWDYFLTCLVVPLLMTTILQWAFLGMFRSMLTVPRPITTIDTLDDMIRSIESDGYWWAASPFFPIYQSLFFDIPKYTKLKEVSKIEEGANPQTESLRRPTDSNFIQFDSFTTARQLFEKIENDAKFMTVAPEYVFRRGPKEFFTTFHVSSDTFGIYGVGPGMTVGSHYADTAHFAITSLIEHGIVGHFSHKCLSEEGRSHEPSIDKLDQYKFDPDIISLIQIKSPLFYLIFGWSLSVLAALFEFCYASETKNNEPVKGTKKNGKKNVILLRGEKNRIIIKYEIRREKSKNWSSGKEPPPFFVASLRKIEVVEDKLIKPNGSVRE